MVVKLVCRIKGTEEYAENLNQREREINKRMEKIVLIMSFIIRFIHEILLQWSN
jgi:hypothetical protein